MKTTVLLRATALAAALCANPLPAGIVISDNLNQPFAAGALLSPSTWAAQAFFSGPYTALEAVHLNLYNGTEGGQFSVQLWDSTGAGGRPGSLVTILASGLSSPTTTDTDNVVSITGLNVPMVKLTSYYVVVRPTSGQLRWGYTSSESGTGFPSEFSFTQNSGGSWSPPSFDDPQRMMVEAVPEASTWMAGAFAGLVLAGGWARKKWLARQTGSVA